MAKKGFKQIQRYKCTMTGEEFKTTRKAPSAGDLISVKAYYMMNPDKDDRPENVKIEIANREASGESMFDDLAASAVDSSDE
jgi:hypothetical protein